MIATEQTPASTTAAATPEDESLGRPSGRGPGRKASIGRVVTGSLAAGLVAALLLVAAPFIPADVSALTGAVLCGFALG